VVSASVWFASASVTASAPAVPGSCAVMTTVDADAVTSAHAVRPGMARAASCTASAICAVVSDPARVKRGENDSPDGVTMSKP